MKKLDWASDWAAVSSVFRPAPPSRLEVRWRNSKLVQPGDTVPVTVMTSRPSSLRWSSERGALYSLMLLPTLSFFSSGTAYENASGGSSYLSTYLGNVGYASVQCAQIPAEVGKLSISCPYGSIGEIYDFGINTDASSKNLCITDDELNASCKPTNDWVSNGLNGAVGESSTLLEWGEHKSFWTGTAAQKLAKKQ